MQGGYILLKWHGDGALVPLEIKTSLSMCSSAAKQEALRMLLEAARTINEASTALEVAAVPSRVLGGDH